MLHMCSISILGILRLGRLVKINRHLVPVLNLLVVTLPVLNLLVVTLQYNCHGILGGDLFLNC